MENLQVKRNWLLVAGMAILILVMGTSAYWFYYKSAPKLTFAQCEAMGGIAWRVDLYDPDICPACTAFRQCELEINDYRVVCPQLAPCGECLQENFPYPDHCPQGKRKIGEISDAAIWFLCCQ